MDTSLLTLMGLLALTHAAFEIVCTPDFCTNVTCPVVTTENCSNTIVPNGGICGCCDSCVQFLKEGESCRTVETRGGPPPTVRCGPGLYCQRTTQKCAPIKTTPVIETTSPAGKGY